MRNIWIVIAVAVVAVAALIWSQRRPREFSVSGLIEAESVRVGSRVGGRVARALVDEGALVRRGDTLLELEPFDLLERLAQARASLAARMSVLDKLRAGSRPEEIEAARAKRDRARAVLDKAIAGPRPLEIRMADDRVALAEADMTKAQFDYDRIQRLRDQGQASDEEIQTVTRGRAVAEANLAVARDQLALLKEGTRTEELAEARASLAETEQTLALLVAGPRAEEIAEAEALAEAAKADVAAVQQQVDELTIAAPFDGVVEAFDLDPGDLVAPGAPIASLLDPAILWVRAYVPENRLSLQIGQSVSLRVDAFPDRRFAGKISFIAREGEFTPSNIQTAEERSKQMFRIKVDLVEGLDILRPGMAADVFLEPAR
jgi:multidrug resistance efflux pump